MKKILCFLLLFTMTVSMTACKKEMETDPAETGELFSPLFRFTVSEGKAAETRVVYLPKSDGFLYLHPGKEGGVTGGFVSPNRSISSEGMFKTAASVTELLVWEDEKDRAHLLTDAELFTLLLKENGMHRTQLPSDLAPKNPIAYNDLSFINEKDGLLLIHPVDFKETYVLADHSRLPDFAGIILPSDGGKKLWYAKSDGDSYTGIGFFEYGSNTPLGSESFSFDSYQRVGESAVLFTRILEKGGAHYLYRDLNSDATASLVSDVVFQGVSCDAAGTVLCGSTSTGEGGKIQVFDFKAGTKKGEYSIDFGLPAPSHAVSADGKTLLVAIGKGHDEILGTLDLTKF